MQLVSTYAVKIKNYNHIFEETVAWYRRAVDFFLDVIQKEWEGLSQLAYQNQKVNALEHFTHHTKKNPTPKYDFDTIFYKFPSYLRRAAIADALGLYSSYQSNVENWKKKDKAIRGRKPGYPKAGFSFPTLYKGNMYKRDGDYEARVKIYIRNTWDYLPVTLKKTDVDYILRHCWDKEECNPMFIKKGKEWFLAFPFKEDITLNTTAVEDQTVLSVDLGLNHAAVCSVMKADGTILGRHFLTLSKEQDSLFHHLNKLKKAQQHGARKTPGRWSRIHGINKYISIQTARFILKIAKQYEVDVIVFEHLDLQGKKRGPRKQMLHLWKARDVQDMVKHQAHREGIRVYHVNAWNTSRLAFDGSGKVERGTYIQDGKECYNYSIATFQTGKQYNCDLNASYNIGARYFIRERLKSLSETVRLDILAKVPECTRRSTCTLSSLIKLNVVLSAQMQGVN